MKRTAFFAGVCALALTSAAQAQPAAGSSSGPTALDEIVVTAQRRAERLQDVPLTVHAVAGQELERAGVTTFRDIQTVVSGFTFAGQGSTSQPSIRGVSTLISAAGSENPNAFYIDGVYQTAQTLLSGDLPDVERIEVLKGPQGTLFGRNATGGAIQIFTRDPTLAPTVDLTADLGYYTGDGGSEAAPRLRLRGFASAPLVDDVLAASLSGAWNVTKGYQHEDAEDRRTGRIERGNVRAKLLFTPTDAVRITLGAYFVQMNNEGALLGTPWKGLSAAAQFPGSVVPREPWHTATDAGSFDLARFKQFGYTARAEFEAGAGRITSLSGYNSAETRNVFSVHNARAALGCLVTFACINYHFEPVTKEFSQELNFASREFGMLSFTTGLFYYRASGGTLGIIQENLVPSGVPVQATNFKKDAYAAYGEATLKPTDALAIIVGLRQNHETLDDSTSIPAVVARKRKFNATTPRVSVRYTLSPDLNVYATYSKGFKSGLTGVTNTGSGFNAVAPETLVSYEVGLKYATPTLTLNASGFYYDYKNKQEQTFTGTSAVILNSGPVRIYGLDLDGSARLSDAFTIRANLSYIPKAEYRDFPNASGQSTVTIPFPPGGAFACAGGGCGGFFPGTGTRVGGTFDATGLRLARAPKLTTSTTLSYERKLAGGDFDASATLYYSSSVRHDITGEIRQGAYATLNAQLGYKPADSHFRVGVYGRNLTNEAYLQAGLTSAAGFIATYAEPREIGLSVNYQY